MNLSNTFTSTTWDALLTFCTSVEEFVLAHETATDELMDEQLLDYFSGENTLMLTCWTGLYRPEKTTNVRSADYRSRLNELTRFLRYWSPRAYDVQPGPKGYYDITSNHDLLKKLFPYHTPYRDRTSPIADTYSIRVRKAYMDKHLGDIRRIYLETRDFYKPSSQFATHWGLNFIFDEEEADQQTFDERTSPTEMTDEEYEALVQKSIRYIEDTQSQMKKMEA